MPRILGRVKSGLRPTPEQRRSLRRAAMLTAAAGVIYAVLFAVSFLLMLRAPGEEATDAEIVDFYSSNQRWVVLLVGLYLMPFAGIAFIWFTVALRMWVSGSIKRENLLYSNLQLVSGIIFVALFFAAGAALTVVAAGAQYSGAEVDPSLARQFPEYSDTLLVGFAFRMAAMFVITTTTIARTAGILPRWFTVLGYVVGVFLLLSATGAGWLVIVFPVWVLFLCGILFHRASQIPKDIELPERLGHGGGLRRA